MRQSIGRVCCKGIHKPGKGTVNRGYGSAALAILSAGCAMPSGVVKQIGPDMYNVWAAPAHGAVGGAREIAYAQATQECGKQGRELLTVSEDSGHDFPAAGTLNLTFRCLDKDDPQFLRGPTGRPQR